MASPSSYAKAADAYKKAVATAATVTAYTVLARSMAREFVPYELRAAARWAVSAARARLMPPPKPRSVKTIFISRYVDGSNVENRFFWDARAYLATRIDPAAMRRLCLTFGGARQMLFMVPGHSMTDVFEGVEFPWTLTSRDPDGNSDDWRACPRSPHSLSLSFDAEQTKVALRRYVPFIMMAMEGTRRRERALQIFMNEHYSWEGINHQHPATFDTVAMDPALKQSIIADLDRFVKRRECYRRIGKAWKHGYLLYGPAGTAAHARYYTIGSAELRRRAVVDVRLDPALLRPGRMDMHVYMGYCCWEAFKTLVRNYFVIDSHELFPEVQKLLSAVEVTPGEVMEMLRRSEDADVALQGFVEFLQDKKKQGTRRSRK
ncbi:AAA-ATPase [Dichanthelium oligosanthes]|uniref:AAA-ATPase n=1 Tax=Dichanthelium oligosanthes TaxID=888268 RepID=A0A1E5UIX3_9POAL|nr:AAA-ATPase [Dichanthelium oligosanthes]